LHALLKTDTSPALPLFGGLAGTAVGLGALWVTGRRWGVAATRPVVLALALYAAAALGLDVVTGVAAAVQNTVGSLTVAGATFVEEFGEALTALVLVVVVRWQSAAPTERYSGHPAGPGP
ncbi:MAG TPA: hypothetical protein VIH08_15255, partial [Blastococcus sp.]